MKSTLGIDRVQDLREEMADQYWDLTFNGRRGKCLASEESLMVEIEEGGTFGGTYDTYQREAQYVLADFANTGATLETPRKTATVEGVKYRVTDIRTRDDGTGIISLERHDGG